MRAVLSFVTIAALAGCGGTPRVDSFDGGYSRTAWGPLAAACMSSDRKARSRELCGCLQAVADRSLSQSDQRQAVRFFADPHRAQEIRQSSRRSDEEFWIRYKDFGTQAERSCG